MVEFVGSEFNVLIMLDVEYVLLCFEVGVFIFEIVLVVKYVFIFCVGMIVFNLIWYMNVGVGEMVVV